jgi:misacylated tRNA(Ala) deacylase
VAQETHLIHQTDSYARSFEATVREVVGDAVLLDRTAFYATSGGQPHDEGTLAWDGGTARVVEVSKKEGRYLHRLAGGPPPVGARVRGEVDWDRRYALMRTHTALHMLAAVIFRDYGAQVTGSNMKPLEGRMDFELEGMSASFKDEVEAKLRAEVEADRKVSVRVLPREEAFRIPDLIRTKVNLLPPEVQQVRVVEIAGLDLQADGGTHVRSTREVGDVRVVGHESKGKINKRLRIGLAPAAPPA